jgi:hypothetical protein
MASWHASFFTAGGQLAAVSETGAAACFSLAEAAVGPTRSIDSLAVSRLSPPRRLAGKHEPIGHRRSLKLDVEAALTKDLPRLSGTSWGVRPGGARTELLNYEYNQLKSLGF